MVAASVRCGAREPRRAYDIRVRTCAPIDGFEDRHCSSEGAGFDGRRLSARACSACYSHVPHIGTIVPLYGTPRLSGRISAEGSLEMPRTLAEKVWERHVVHRTEGEPDLLYVDLHLVHEVTS